MFSMYKRSEGNEDIVDIWLCKWMFKKCLHCTCFEHVAAFFNCRRSRTKYHVVWVVNLVFYYYYFKFAGIAVQLNRYKIVVTNWYKYILLTAKLILNLCPTCCTLVGGGGVKVDIDKIHRSMAISCWENFKIFNFSEGEVWEVWTNKWNRGIKSFSSYCVI